MKASALSRILADPALGIEDGCCTQGSTIPMTWWSFVDELNLPSATY